jgi:hypothetical protein
MSMRNKYGYWFEIKSGETFPDFRNKIWYSDSGIDHNAFATLLGRDDPAIRAEELCHDSLYQ